MNLRFFLLNLTAIVFLSACASNTTKLQLGMTKAEVIKIMGKPNSVSAEGNAELLNYLLSEEASSTTTTTVTPPASVFASNPNSAYGTPYRDANQPGIQSRTNMTYRNRRYIVKLIDGKVSSFGFNDQLSQSKRTAPSSSENNYEIPPRSITVGGIEFTYSPTAYANNKLHCNLLPDSKTASGNSVTITSIDAYQDQTRGVSSVDVVIRVSYSLSDQENAWLECGHGFKKDKFYVTVREKIPKGTGEAVFTISATPTAWTGKPWTIAVFLKETSKGEIMGRSDRYISAPAFGKN